MGNEAVTPAPTCWVSAEPRRTEGERSPREGSGGGALRAAPLAAHALRPPARCGRLPRRPCGEQPPVRGWWARRAPLRRPRGAAAGMRGAGRRSRVPRAAALGLALLLASCVQVGERGGLCSRLRATRLSLPPSLPPLSGPTMRVIFCTYIDSIYMCACAAVAGFKPSAGESWRRGGGERLATALRSPRCRPPAVVTKLSPL